MALLSKLDAANDLIKTGPVLIYLYVIILIKKYDNSYDFEFDIINVCVYAQYRRLLPTLRTYR